MAIKVGDALPSGITLKELTDGALKDVTTQDLFKGRKVVVFAVPGAFTPTCSKQHLPGFVTQAQALRAKGVDDVVCIAVNDAFVMAAWGEAQHAAGKVRMLADGNADFTKALGLTLDASGFGMGIRSQRYAMVVNDGTVQELLLEGGGGLSCSTAEAVLKTLG